MLTLLDISFNSFSGFLPSSLCHLASCPNASIYLCSPAAVNSNEGCGAITSVPACLYPNSPNHRIGKLTEYFVTNNSSGISYQNYAMCSLARAWNVSGWDCFAGYPTNLCVSWTGVQCDGPYVGSISVVYFGIVGSIPTSLGLSHVFTGV